jgi:hypothetical protein
MSPVTPADRTVGTAESPLVIWSMEHYISGMLRVLLFGAAWTLVLAALVFAFRRPVSPPLASVTSDSRPAVLPPPPPPPRAGTRFPGWTVTKAYSAHHVMVVEVETDLLDTARQIAAQVVEPVKDRYDEVLIYIRKPETPYDALPARRIQWTRRAGYVETVY